MILKTKIDLKDSSVVGGIAKEYLNDKTGELISFQPDLNGFKSATDERSKFPVNRKILVDILKKQNENASVKTQENIESLLNENSFTVTTGHQLCLLTGPLYFIYKIIHAIKLAEALKDKFPDKNFVPVYWMATEDHDFEEVSSFHLFGKTLKWETESNGAVGRLSLKKAGNLNEILTRLKDILGETEKAKEIFSVIEKAYSEENLAEATRSLVNYLFKDSGLIIIDADTTELKKLFIPFFEKELKEQFVIGKVEETSKTIVDKGFKVQVTPREINIFYLRDQLRERIVLENEKYQTVNGEYQWTQEDILKELRSNPENFSPNVLMRPLYQETILPNITYIGGGGEISYWLQMKNMFEAANVFFPVLMVRNSFLIIDKGTQDKISKLGFESTNFFKQEEELVVAFIQRNATVDFDLNEEAEKIKSTYHQLGEKVKQLDPTLEGSVSAELQKALKSMEIIEAKIRKAEKQKHEQSLNQIKNIKEKLFPEGSFQERYDNFLSFYLKSEGELVNWIGMEISPMESTLNILNFN